MARIKVLVKIGRGDELIVTLPHTFSRDSLYMLIGALMDALAKRPKKIILDFKSLERIQVGGIAVLSNMIEHCKKEDIQIEFRNTAGCASADFLQGAGFSELYFGKSSESNASNLAFSKLKLVEYNKSHSYLNNELVPWLAEILSLSVRALASLKVCFEEIFNNIKDHSSVNVGCSCAHYDSVEKKLRYAYQILAWASLKMSMPI